MKAIVLFICCLIAALISEAQTNVYHKFPTDTCDWVIATQQFGDSNIYVHPNFYFGDTIINNYHYIKVFSEVAEYWGIYMYREDTLNRKVYAKALEPNYYNQDTTEYLLYDFSLNLGDSVLINWHNTYDLNSTVPRYLHCTGIDSVECIDGYHKRLKMEFFETPYWNYFNFQNYDYWTEGVGSSFGIFYFIPLGIGFWGDQFLYCFFAADYPINPIYGLYCYFFVQGTADKTIRLNMNFFPNPATSGQPIYVKYNASIKEVLITDINGRFIGQLQNVSGGTYTMPSEINTEGIYILSIMDNLGNIFHQKIIIQPYIL